MTPHRSDGLNNELSINSGIGCTWEAVSKMCEESEAVESYFQDDGFWIQWVGIDGMDKFSDPQAAIIAIQGWGTT